MFGLVLLAIYIIGIPIWIFVEKKFFPFKDGDYTIEFDGAHEITPEMWKCDVEARAALWPFCLAVIIMLIPFRLIDTIFEIL